MVKIRLLIADNLALVRGLLSNQLSKQEDFEILGAASNGQEAVELALCLKPDIVIMALEMPVLNGVQATGRILARNSTIKVILLTNHEHLSSLGRFSEASECLSKSCTPEELVEAIRRVWDLRHTIPDGLGSNKDQYLMVERMATRAGLSANEKAVLIKVLDTDLTMDQIAGTLSSESGSSVTISSVKHALGRAMTKLRIKPRTRTALVKYAREISEGQAAGANGLFP